MTTKKTKQKIRVGFTREQHQRVHDFLEYIKPTAEKDLGSPVQVKVDWSDQNEHGKPHVHLNGRLGEKTIFLKDILEANDEDVVGPVAEIIPFPGGKDVH